MNPQRTKTCHSWDYSKAQKRILKMEFQAWFKEWQNHWIKCVNSHKRQSSEGANLLRADQETHSTAISEEPNPAVLILSTVAQTGQMPTKPGPLSPWAQSWPTFPSQPLNGKWKEVIWALLAPETATAASLSSLTCQRGAENSGEDSEGLEDVQLQNRMTVVPERQCGAELPSPFWLVSDWNRSQK